MSNKPYLHTTYPLLQYREVQLTENRSLRPAEVYLLLFVPRFVKELQLHRCRSLSYKGLVSKNLLAISKAVSTTSCIGRAFGRRLRKRAISDKAR